MLNKSCILGLNLTWSGYTVLFIYYNSQFAKILLRIFSFMFMGDIGLSSCSVFVLSWYQGNADLIEQVEKCFPIFQTSLYQNWLFFS